MEFRRAELQMNYSRVKIVAVLCILACGVYYVFVLHSGTQVKVAEKVNVGTTSESVDVKPAERKVLKKDDNVTTVDYAHTAHHDSENVLINAPLLIPEELHMGGMKCHPDPVAFRMHTDFAALWKKAEWYVKFHSKGVENIRRGKSDLVKTLIWYCPDKKCVDLGYRFHGIIFSLFVAMFTNRVLILDWQGVSDEVQFLRPNRIDWRWKHLPLVGRKEVIGNFMKSRRNLPGKFMTLVRDPDVQHLKAHYNAHIKFASALMSNDPSIISSFHNNLFKTLISHKYIIDAFAINYLFKFSDDMLKYSQQIRQNIGHFSYVALHLRTDDSELPGKSGVSPIKQWKQALDCAIHQAAITIGPQAVVLIVSDSYKATAWASQIYNSKIKILNTTVIHTKKSSELHENSREMLRVWQDLIVMAEASTLVMKLNSFPELAVALCALAPSRVIDYTTCKQFMQT